MDRLNNDRGWPWWCLRRSTVCRWGMESAHRWWSSCPGLSRLVQTDDHLVQAADKSTDALESVHSRLHFTAVAHVASLTSLCSHVSTAGPHFIAPIPPVYTRVFCPQTRPNAAICANPAICCNCFPSTMSQTRVHSSNASVIYVNLC